MAVAEIGPSKYGKLLAKTLPKVIETRAEFDRCVEIVEQLDRAEAEAGGPLSPEGEALRSLLERLVKDYDDKIELPRVEPHRLVFHLMEHKGLPQADMLPVFGSRSVASDVLNGRRKLSKNHIRRLAEFFNLPADLFL